MKAERVSLSFQCSSRPLRPRYSRTPLQRVDALFQFAAIDGERVFAADVDQADLYELVVMRKAAELLPIQRAIEHDRFGVSTS